MVLEKLELKNFRLHKSTKINFSNKLNYIVGGNGQGKTTILEAIYYLCTTKNLNNNSDSEVISFDQDFFEIEGSFKNLVDNKVRINLLRENSRKQTFLDDKQINRAASFIGKFPVVTLTQSDHSLTLGSPSGRRKFVDSVISQSSVTYLKIILDYNKTLRQRSYLLTKIKETGDKSLLDQLEAWDELLIKNGVQIIDHRKHFVAEFNEYVKESYENLLNGKEYPEIFYSFHEEEKEEVTEDLLRRLLAEKRKVELVRCVNLVGPHRDDFIFKINNIDLKKYGSQGQHKTFQIALKFGQFFFMKDKLENEPVFLMDDVFGELDGYRAGKTSDFLRSVGQAFITLTDFTKYSDLVNKESDFVMEVNHGSVSYV